jgi:hypothetical protein
MCLPQSIIVDGFSSVSDDNANCAGREPEVSEGAVFLSQMAIPMRASV